MVREFPFYNTIIAIEISTFGLMSIFANEQ